jgi:hypothetical protein
MELAPGARDQGGLGLVQAAPVLELQILVEESSG